MTTGTDVIRAALYARNKKTNLATMARDLNMQTGPLEDFAEGRLSTLPPATLQKIAAYIWPNGTTYNAAADLLEHPNKGAAKALPVYPTHATPDPHWVKAEYTSVKKARLPSFTRPRPGWM
jgi:hypothetical protein